MEVGAVQSFAAYSPGEEGKQGMSRRGGRIHITCYCMSTTRLFTSEPVIYIPVKPMQRNTWRI